MRVVADGADDAFVLAEGGAALQILCPDAPCLECALCGVARDALGAAGRLRERHGVAGRCPFLDERMVHAAVALAAVVLAVDRHLDRRERDIVGIVRVLGVVEARPVTALALHVVIGDVLHRVPADGARQRVATLGDRMAGEAERLRMVIVFQGLVGAGMRGVLPFGLLSDMAVAARGLVVFGREIAEESGRFVGRGVDRLTEDDAFVGARAREQRCGDEEPGHRSGQIAYGHHRDRPCRS